MDQFGNVLDLFDEQELFWKQKVSEGIEQHRKGSATVKLIDQDGKPIRNATVKINQKSHAFRFGANLFMLDEFETEEKNNAYKKAFSDVFNMATLPFYWDTLELDRGNPRFAKDSPKVYRRPPIDLCLEFCRKNGIEPREHALAYDRSFPKWLYNASVEEIKQELERRFAEIAERYSDSIRTIEVTNEMEWKQGRTKFYDEPDYVEWCFKLAEKYFPNNQLVINEHTGSCWEDRCRATDKYYAYVEANMLKGARIDAIGAQYHLFKKREELYEKTRTLLDPKSLYKHMDLYAGLGKPLQITEVTIPAYSWEAEDEAMQANIIEKLYSVWFSHPAVEQIIYWNLVDGYAHVPNIDVKQIASTQGDMTIGENYYHGGLLRFDMSPKPAYNKIKELTQKVWHTEISQKLDETGALAFRGFYGKYDVEILINGHKETKEITLSKDSENTFTLTV